MTCQISNVRGNHINLSFVEKFCGYEEINCVMPFPRMRNDIYDNIQRFKFSLPSFLATNEEYIIKSLESMKFILSILDLKHNTDHVMR